MIIRVICVFFMLIELADAALLVEDYPPVPATKITGVKSKTSMPFLPFFSGTNDIEKKAAAKINEILFLTKLSRPPLKASDSMKPLYDNISSIEEVDDVSSSGDYSYEVLRNDEKVISVNLHEESCAASCGTNNYHYNFDARTGRYIHVSSLFTRSGLQKVSSILIKEWAADIRNDAAGDELSEEMVKECISNMRTNYNQNTPYTGYDFVIDKGGINFVGAYCTKIVSNYPAALSYKKISNLLSAYGKSLFSNDASIEQPVQPFGQIFEGVIGEKYPIKMALIEPYPSAGYLEGYYLYKKYNKPIRISGTYTNGVLVLQETDATAKPTGPKITAFPTANGFSGYWDGNNKKLKFSVVIDEAK